MERLLSTILYSGHTYDETEQDLKFRIFYYNCGVGFLALATLLMGFYRIQQYFILGVIEFSFSAASFALLLLLRKDKRWAEAIISAGIFLAYILFTLLFLAVPNLTVFAIFFSLLGAVIFLKGRKKGLPWLLIILTTIFAVHLLGMRAVGYSDVDMITIVLYYIGMFIILFTFDVMKDAQSRELRTLNENLEQKIRERTEELQKLNETLAQRVEEEVETRLKVEKQREEQEKQLIQQSKMASMGEMIGAIAHQWKQPLNAINLTVQELKDQYQYKELNETNLTKLGKTIQEQVSFMDQTIDDFRGFFKPSKTKISFNLHEAVTSIRNILTPELKRSGIEVRIEGDAMLSAFGYPNEFKQVILNIVNNAKEELIRQKHPAPLITILIGADKTFNSVRIRDNAGGIPEALLPDKLFEAYVSTKGDAGTGIGLHMSKSIVEGSMNGRLTVRNLKEGAEFTIELPKEAGE